MNQALAAPGRWMNRLGRLLRHFGNASSIDTPRSAPSPACRPTIVPVRPPGLRLAPMPAARPPATALSRRVVRSPLRVVRIVESGQASALAGRILMSGRMSDVCAELDRMVERESAIRVRA